MTAAEQQLADQLTAIQQGLFRISPRDRIRALSTHETDDLIIELQDLADAALVSLKALADAND